MKLTTRYSLLTCVFLVLLRLAIGWQFFYEGLEKFGSGSWSSEFYLRESTGPLAPTFHWMAGDPLLDRLQPAPGPSDKDPLRVTLHERFPPALAPEWDAYFTAFVQHYHLNDQQRGEAEGKFAQQKDKLVEWLLLSKKTITTPSPYGPPVVAEKSIPEWVQVYKDRLAAAQKVEREELPAAAGTLFEAQVNAKLRSLKDDANRIRASLKSDLDAQTANLKDTLNEVPTPEQKAQCGAMPGSVAVGWLNQTRLDWIDASVRWGLLAVGICLLLGLFSRPACVAGAAFLLLFYLAMPPILGVPVNPTAEGHFPPINKNFIEMVALLALATTPSGRWLGLDGLLQFLWPSRWRQKRTVVVEDRRSIPNVLAVEEPADVAPASGRPVAAPPPAAPDPDHYPNTPFTPHVPTRRE